MKSLAQSPLLNELVSIVVIGVGMAGIFRAAQAVGELLYTLECAGAMGGTRQE